jgi:cytochrome c peroxidase
LTTEEKQALLEELKEARYSGALRVKFGARDVTYKSDAEMAKAINALEQELNGQPAHSATFAEFGSGL